MKDRRLIKKLEVAEGRATHIKVELYYSLGGMNYFSGNNERRGLYLSVSPVTIGEGFESFTAFSGVKQFAKEMPRFNQKVLDTFEVEEALVNQLVNHVVEKNKITLKS